MYAVSVFTEGSGINAEGLRATAQHGHAQRNCGQREWHRTLVNARNAHLLTL